MRGFPLSQMKTTKLKMMGAVGAVALVALLSSGCNKLKARDNLNKGVNAFKAGQ
jgi:hypothetical protein